MESHEEKEVRGASSLSKGELAEAADLIRQVIKDGRIVILVFLNDENNEFRDALDDIISDLEDIANKNDQEIQKILAASAKILNLIVGGNQGKWDFSF